MLLTEISINLVKFKLERPGIESLEQDEIDRSCPVLEKG